jgi:chromosome segregation ATPase
MAIASVVQGLIETEDGKVFELDSCKGSAWLESIGSFRYEPTGANKPYTVRQETKKGGDYWYGYRKVAGKLHKKYIGKSSELSTAKLEEIAEALNTPQQPRVTQVTDTVTQVTEANNQQVTDAVTDSHTAERVTALELQMQALRESLEALRSELLGKPEGLSNFSELPNPYEVTDSELQIELSNLKTELSNLATENEKIRADYDALLESSTVVTKKLDKKCRIAIAT